MLTGILPAGSANSVCVPFVQEDQNRPKDDEREQIKDHTTFVVELPGQESRIHVDGKERKADDSDPILQQGHRENHQRE